MWLILSFISASLLGFYDISKKQSLNNNAVIPVLFTNILVCCIILLPIIIFSSLKSSTIEDTIFYLKPISIYQHCQLIIKAVIVLSSWLFAYFSMKHLPITIAAPIKATQPILTLLGALIIFGERLNGFQWIGIIISIISLFLLSFAGKKEGINFKSNKWVLFMIMAIVTGAMSGLYDKFLMKTIDKMNVQVWYNYYQLLIMFIILITLWYPKRRSNTPFQWRWSIPLIAIFLLAADFAYFNALSYEKSMISIVSLVRRGGVVISFFAGVILFKDKNIKSKILDLALVIVGMYFIYLGSK